MLDANYFRSQAELNFELARRMSVPGDAEYFRHSAEECLERAAVLEALVPASPPSPTPRAGARQGSKTRMRRKI